MRLYEIIIASEITFVYLHVYQTLIDMKKPPKIGGSMVEAKRTSPNSRPIESNNR